MLMTQRPFRTPHHTVSPVALVGAGRVPSRVRFPWPTTASFFSMSFRNFPVRCLKCCASRSRTGQSQWREPNTPLLTRPLFMLVASMNPCPCGYYGHPAKLCTCTPGQVSRYMSRISGPLLDRIDLQVEIQPVAFDEMAVATPSESSMSIRDRVVAARAVCNRRATATKKASTATLR